MALLCAFSGDSGTVVKSASVAINMARLSEMNGSTVVRSAVNITENGNRQTLMMLCLC